MRPRHLQGVVYAVLAAQESQECCFWSQEYYFKEVLLLGCRSSWGW